MATDDEIAALKAELDRLRSENAALRARQSEATDRSDIAPPQPAPPSSRSTADKLALFKRYFAGRPDVYPLRWQNAAGRAGYSPACHREWQPGVCGKPAVKCGACPNQAFKALDDTAILDHLRGRLTLGVYPLFTDDTCRFLAVDFDERDWRTDALAYATVARAADVPVALEISRSGAGAHAWTFFDGPVPAAAARALGTALLTATCRERRQLALASYDRLFPNQDVLPKGGFGSLIALPFQHEPRLRGCTLFVDDAWQPYADQWAYLDARPQLTSADLDARLAALRADGPPLDAVLPVEDETEAPWRRPTPGARVSGPAPARLLVTQAQQLYVAKDGLSPRWIHALARLAAFQNPAFYQAQAVRRSVWNIPRLIGCAENHPAHVGVPRGLLNAVQSLADAHNVPIEYVDARAEGAPLAVAFSGTLTDDQAAALAALAAHDTGVLWAPTGFGKTVVAAALIARRAVATLVLVHRAELMTQWRERLTTFLAVPENTIGVCGAGRDTLTGRIDVALLQSLARRRDRLDPRAYGHLIVDEAHHVPAASFEQVLAAFAARYVAGLTATPVRRDGQHPIMQMQLGPIRWSARRAQARVAAPRVQIRRLQRLSAGAPGESIQSLMARLAREAARVTDLAQVVATLVDARRRVLVLTERTDHLDRLAAALASLPCPRIDLHGRLGRRARAQALADLRAIADDQPFVVLATGRLIGEGFDEARLDALVLAMPFSWKGTLQQYVGRLMRASPGKAVARVLDFEDVGVPMLERMAAKRRAGYRQLGCEVEHDDEREMRLALEGSVGPTSSVPQ